MICVSATNDLCTEVVPGAAQIASALLVTWMQLRRQRRRWEPWQPALLSLGQGRATCWLKQGWDPGGQPLTPSSAPHCFCGLGVTAQRGNLLVWLLPDRFQSRRAVLTKSICLSGVSGWTRGAGASSSAGEKVGRSWRHSWVWEDSESHLQIGGSCFLSLPSPW